MAQTMMGVVWAVSTPPSLIALPSSFPCTGKIHHPPYEQVLVGVGVGTVGLVQVVPCFVVQVIWCTHYTPNEQWLVSVGVGAPSSSAHSVGRWVWHGHDDTHRISLSPSSSLSCLLLPAAVITSANPPKVHPPSGNWGGAGLIRWS